VKSTTLNHCLLVIAILLAPSLHAADQPKINKGLLDLSEWDFTHDGPVYLVGGAEFFWTQHLDSQDFYRLTQIQICQQSDEAVAALQHFDLIIVDSDTDGYRTITKLQEQSDQNIILLSSDLAVARDFIGSPQHRIVSKPSTLSELAHSVAEFLRS
jgi:hypothetical protein